jgi:hypothetical protein
MTSTPDQVPHHVDAVDELLVPPVDGRAPRPISGNRLLASLKEAAGWPGADRNTVVTLALLLVAARADAEGSRFQELSERNQADAAAQALAHGPPTRRARIPRSQDRHNPRVIRRRR